MQTEKKRKTSTFKLPQLKKGDFGFKPQRWLLISFLYFIIFLNGVAVFITFMVFAYAPKLIPKIAHSNVSLEILAGLAILNIYFLLSILRKRRWGFWGFCASTIVSVIYSINFGTPITHALMGLLAPIIVFALLNVGGKRSAWREMKQQNTAKETDNGKIT